MPTFELTANRQMSFGNGNIITKGQQITLNICQLGITPNNLFNNSRCEKDILRQFSNQGIDIPPRSHILNRGNFEIKQL